VDRWGIAASWVVVVEPAQMAVEVAHLSQMEQIWVLF